MFVSRPGANVCLSLISLCVDGKFQATDKLIKFTKSNVSICPSCFHINHFKIRGETKTVHDWTGMLKSSTNNTSMDNNLRCVPERRLIPKHSVRGHQFWTELSHHWCHEMPLCGTSRVGRNFPVKTTTYIANYVLPYLTLLIATKVVICNPPSTRQTRFCGHFSFIFKFATIQLKLIYIYNDTLNSTTLACVLSYLLTVVPFPCKSGRLHLWQKDGKALVSKVWVRNRSGCQSRVPYWGRS